RPRLDDGSDVVRARPSRAARCLRRAQPLARAPDSRPHAFRNHERTARHPPTGSATTRPDDPAALTIAAATRTHHRGQRTSSTILIPADQCPRLRADLRRDGTHAASAASTSPRDGDRAPLRISTRLAWRRPHGASACAPRPHAGSASGGSAGPRPPYFSSFCNSGTGESGPTGTTYWSSSRSTPGYLARSFGVNSRTCPPPINMLIAPLGKARPNSLSSATQASFPESRLTPARYFFARPAYDVSCEVISPYDFQCSSGSTSLSSRRRTSLSQCAGLK